MKGRLPWAVLLLVALVLAVAAAGCGGDDGEEDEAPAATEGTTRASAEPISVGMVSDTGGLDDRGFNEFSINGFERAQERARRRRPRLHVRVG